MTVDDLAQFLTERYDEAEARERKMLEMLASAGPGATIAICFDDGTSSNAVDWNPWDVIEEYDPNQRLADIKLKRAILADYHAAGETMNRQIAERLPGPTSGDVYLVADPVVLGEVSALSATVRQLGTEYADHPAYRQEWAPAT